VTNILSFDVESNGLHGQPFALGAVLLDSDGQLIDQLELRCPIEGDIDPWDAEHVIPQLDGMIEHCPTFSDFLEHFWRWFQDHKDGALIFADFGYPVETGLLHMCQRQKLEERAWKGPYPLHDLGTLLLAKGYDPDINRVELATQLTSDHSAFRQHHPFYDALASGLIAWKLTQ